MNEQDFEQGWKVAMQKMEDRFEQPIDVQAALFLIGLNELGQGPKNSVRIKKLT